MLRFFRHIRQKLLQQNRVTRYLVYALGEILLVVIGILIALQVNNWNESQKQNRKKNQALTIIISNLESDLEILSTNIRNGKQAILYWDNFGINDSLSLPELFYNRLSRPGIRVSDTGYIKALNEDVINNLGNESLKLALIQYYDSDFKYYELSQARLEKDYEFVRDKALILSSDISRFPSLQMQIKYLMSNPSFEKVLESYIRRSQNLLPIIEERAKQCQTLKESIETELERR